MPDMETLLAELFGFQQFERSARLQELIDETLNRYDDDLRLSTDDLETAAGGINVPPPDNEGSGSE